MPHSDAALWKSTQAEGNSSVVKACKLDAVGVASNVPGNAII